jgi:hypothetical protein
MIEMRCEIFYQKGRILLLSCLFLSLCSHLDAQEIKPISLWADSLPPMDSLDETRLSHLVEELVIRNKSLLDTCLQRSAHATNERTAAEVDWNNIRQDTSAGKSLKDSLNTRLKTAKSREKACLSDQKQAEKNLAAAEKLFTSPAIVQRKNILKQKKASIQCFFQLFPPPPDPVPTPVVAEIEKTPAFAQDTTIKTSLPTVKTPKTASSYKAYRPEEDVTLNPPVPPCVLLKNVRDEFSGEIQKESPALEWFRFTNPVMRNFLKGKTHIQCSAALESKGDNTFLLLTFTMNDPAPKKSFGGLGKNALVSLKMIDGSNYFLYNLQADEGVFDPETSETRYRGRFLLEKALVKKIRSTETDKLRVTWNTGYEDYDIQQVDALKRLSLCF